MWKALYKAFVICSTTTDWEHIKENGCGSWAQVSKEDGAG